MSYIISFHEQLLITICGLLLCYRHIFDLISHFSALKYNWYMKILAIETSCDETAAAVVEDGIKALSNIISSQTKFHEKYGGVVPEIASRKHIETISYVVKEAVDQAGTGFKDIDAVAVTFGPGLPGSLLVGLSYAKALAFSLGKPLLPVNHLEGHLYANFLLPSPQSLVPGPSFPFICLIVSGGHTQIVLVKDHGKYGTLGRTRDDAAGEAYDKVARFLGLGYPGGPVIDKLSKEGDPDAIDFTRPMLDDGYDFSFSGIKTAVVYYVKKMGTRPPLSLSGPLPLTKGETADRREGVQTADIAASFQKAVVETLVEKTIRAALEKGVKTAAIGGGVSANSYLRKRFAEECEKNGIKAVIPPFELCTDNAAMVGSAAYFRHKNGLPFDKDPQISSVARL